MVIKIKIETASFLKRLKEIKRAINECMGVSLEYISIDESVNWTAKEQKALEKILKNQKEKGIKTQYHKKFLD